jgi:hypothetical protein
MAPTIARMRDYAILGPQFHAPNLSSCLAALGVAGPLVAVTAGWQEREGEIEELKDHVQLPVTDLQLYARAEQVHAADPALAAAARERQERLQEMQDFYRVRLMALMGACAELDAQEGSSAALRRARRGALGDVRRLDRAHVAATRRSRRKRKRSNGRSPAPRRYSSRVATSRCC